VILLHLFLTYAVDGGECWGSRPTRKELPTPVQSRRPYGAPEPPSGRTGEVLHFLPLTGANNRNICQSRNFLTF
jgi:hypothetical protein